MDEALLRRGILKRSRVDRLVARISVQLLHNLTCLLIATPHVAWSRGCFANPVVECGEVCVERLRRRAVRPRLHEFSIRREALWGGHTQEIRRVDNRLPLEALHFVEGLGDRCSRDRHEHGFGLRNVSAVSAYPRHLVARFLPEIGESATDTASANHCELHVTPSSSLGSLAQLAVPPNPSRVWKL